MLTQSLSTSSNIFRHLSFYLIQLFMFCVFLPVVLVLLIFITFCSGCAVVPLCFLLQPPTPTGISLLSFPEGSSSPWPQLQGLDRVEESSEVVGCGVRQPGEEADGGRWGGPDLLELGPPGGRAPWSGLAQLFHRMSPVQSHKGHLLPDLLVTHC